MRRLKRYFGVCSAGKTPSAIYRCLTPCTTCLTLGSLVSLWTLPNATPHLRRPDTSALLIIAPRARRRGRSGVVFSRNIFMAMVFPSCSRSWTFFASSPSPPSPRTSLDPLRSSKSLLHRRNRLPRPSRENPGTDFTGVGVRCLHRDIHIEGSHLDAVSFTDSEVSHQADSDSLPTRSRMRSTCVRRQTNSTCNLDVGRIASSVSDPIRHAAKTM